MNMFRFHLFLVFLFTEISYCGGLVLEIIINRALILNPVGSGSDRVNFKR